MDKDKKAATAVPPGRVVIDELGLMPTVDGLRKEFPSLSKSTVWRWAQPRDDGGTDGIVPSRYHRPLMRLAQQMGRKLTAEDLVFGRAAS
jgi:hypothetical protein